MSIHLTMQIYRNYCYCPTFPFKIHYFGKEQQPFACVFYYDMKILILSEIIRATLENFCENNENTKTSSLYSPTFR